MSAALLRAEAEIAAAASEARRNLIARGARLYPPDRERILRELIRATQAEIADTSPEGREYILQRLEMHINARRAAASAGHWTAYDPNILIALEQAHAGELWLAMVDRCEPKKFITVYEAAE